MGTYESICDSSLTCIEPETRGEIVSGTEFHKFYFDNTKNKTNSDSNLVTNVTILGEGDSAIISYIRLTQVYNKVKNEFSATSREEETRVWEKIDGKWWHVHFHRSNISA